MQTITADPDIVEIPVAECDLDDGDALAVEEIRDVAYTRC